MTVLRAAHHRLGNAPATLWGFHHTPLRSMVTHPNGEKSSTVLTEEFEERLTWGDSDKNSHPSLLDCFESTSP
jgi:hypothetical protein